MRRYLIGLTVVAIMFATAIIVIPWLVPLDYDKDQITTEIKAITGRDLTIAGPLRLSLFPRLSVEADGVVLSNPPGSLDPAMLKLDTINAELRILPLFAGQLEIARFILKQPQIDLEIDQNGVPNWLFSHNAPIPAPGTAAPVSTAANGSAAASLDRLTVTKLYIDNGAIRFENRRNHTSELVTGVTADVVLPGTTGPLMISGSGTTQNHRYVASLSGRVTMTPTVVRIDGSVFKIDSIAGTGAISVDTSGLRPRIIGNLVVHRLDLTPYLPATAKPVPAPSPPGKRPASSPPSRASPPGWDDTPVDFSPLGRIDLDLLLSADEIRARKLDFGKTDFHAVVSNGQLQLDVSQISAYGGRGGGTLSIHQNGSMASIQAGFSLAGIQIQPFLTNSIGFDRLSGNASWTTRLSATGRTQQDFIRSLDGTGKLQLVNGSLRGFNLVDMLAHPLRDFVQPGGRTSIEHLTASYVIAQGVVANDDLNVKSGNLTSQGAGTIDLPARSLDYRLTPRLGISIPIRISGPWDALHYHMDFKFLPALDKFHGKPIDAVRKGLKSLFKIP